MTLQCSSSNSSSLVWELKTGLWLKVRKQLEVRIKRELGQKFYAYRVAQSNFSNSNLEFNEIIADVVLIVYENRITIVHILYFVLRWNLAFNLRLFWRWLIPFWSHISNELFITSLSISLVFQKNPSLKFCKIL